MKKDKLPTLLQINIFDLFSENEKQRLVNMVNYYLEDTYGKSVASLTISGSVLVEDLKWEE